MISKFDTWGIVLAGHWNRMIFTPEWVGANLFHQEEIETEIMLMPIFPIIYRHNQVVMEASGAKRDYLMAHLPLRTVSAAIPLESA